MRYSTVDTHLSLNYWLCVLQRYPHGHEKRGPSDTVDKRCHCVLLERIYCNNFVHQLQVDCLFEADFSWQNKHMFTHHMTEPSRDKDVILDNFFAKRIKYPLHLCQREQ